MSTLGWLNLMKKSNFLTAIFLAITLLCSSVALADKHGHGHDGDDNEGYHESHHHKDKHDNDRPEHIVIVSQNRDIIKQYLYEDYDYHCPPGLRKKHRCYQPSVRYVIGQRLPESVRWEPLPTVVLQRIEPAPVGYQYVTVDKNVLLMSTASHEIIDAITLLSAVGH
jgi:hypothetical protein